MDRISGWFLLIGGLLAGAALMHWDSKNSSRPGSRGSLPRNPHLTRAAHQAQGSAPVTAPGGAGTSGAVQGSSTSQQVGTTVLDPEGDEGASPSPRGQTEAAYNQGANDMGDPFGAHENRNDEDGLEELFSY